MRGLTPLLIQNLTHRHRSHFVFRSRGCSQIRAPSSWYMFSSAPRGMQKRFLLRLNGKQNSYCEWHRVNVCVKPAARKEDQSMGLTPRSNGIVDELFLEFNRLPPSLRTQLTSLAHAPCTAIVIRPNSSHEALYVSRSLCRS